MEDVKVISSTLVGMANSSGHSTLELTPWELSFLLLDPIQKGILFNNPKNRSQQSADEFIDHLRSSLSRTLDFFPWLSGRLGRVTNHDGTASFFMDCNDAGAEFTHAAAATVSVSDILEPRYVPQVVSSFFTLNETPNYEGVSKPLLGVQVTELMDGLFVGCTANHVVVDGTSFWQFFNSWSEISRGCDTISKAPVFDRWFPDKVSHEDRIIRLPMSDQTLLNKSPATPLLERIFCFNKDSLAKLKAKARSETCNDKISTLQALSAHLWRTVVRSQNRQSSNNDDLLDNQEDTLKLLVDARARVRLQDRYFGCAVYRASTVIRRRDLLQNGLGFTAQQINELVGQQTSEAAIGYVREWMNRPDLRRKTNREFVITSSPRFSIYGCDFGWGKPVAVRSGAAQKFDGKMTLVPPADEAGGIEVQVCLAPETMMAMEDDAEHMELVTA